MFNKRLQELRSKRGLTQKELASRVGLARTTYSGYENGTREPDHKTLTELANFFEVDVDYLLGNDAKAADAERSLEEQKLAAMGQIAKELGFDLTNEDDFNLIRDLIRTVAKARK